MKKYLKYAFFSLIMMFVIVMCNGCQFVYNVTIKYDSNGQEMAGKSVDILLPMDKEDSIYCDFKGENLKADIGENSEIARYSDGYMSCRFHNKRINNVETDSDKTVITLSNKGCYEYLCENYEKFRLALIDDNGNIIQISEELPFKSSEKYYLDNSIIYNPQTNEVTPKYKNIEGGNIWMYVALIFAWIAPVAAVVLLLVIFLPKDVSFAESPWVLVPFGVNIIPLLVYVFFRYDEAVKSSINQKMAWKIFFDIDYPAIVLPCILLPYFAFILAGFFMANRRKNSHNIVQNLPK